MTVATTERIMLLLYKFNYDIKLVCYLVRYACSLEKTMFIKLNNMEYTHKLFLVKCVFK